MVHVHHHHFLSPHTIHTIYSTVSCYTRSLPRHGNSALVEGEELSNDSRALPVDAATKLLQLVISLVRHAVPGVTGCHQEMRNDLIGREYLRSKKQQGSILYLDTVP